MKHLYIQNKILKNYFCYQINRVARQLLEGKNFVVLRNQSDSASLFLNSEPVKPGDSRVLRANDLIGLFESSFTVFTYFDPNDNDQAKYANSLTDRYILMKTLGAGAFAETKLAFCRENNEPRAIKIIKKDSVDDSKVLEKEAQVLQAAAHKLVIKLYEVIDSASHLFIVMELAGGGANAQ